MINCKKDYRVYLQEDKKALYPNGCSYIHALTDPIWRFEKRLRKCEYLRNTHKRPYISPRYLISKWKLHKLGVKLGFSIPENVCGPGLSLAHYGCIVINPQASIGANCRIHCGVCIGANKDANDVPIIGDNCYIGPGAKIFGKITIGNNTKIGANAVVTKSFEGNCVLTGIPAVITKQFEF